MFETFERHLLSLASFTPAEIVQIERWATVKHLAKKEYFLHEGEINRHKIFVKTGLLRAYRLAPDGSEHIMRFAPENTWMIDHESYSRQAPSRYFIQAMEEATLLVWAKQDMEQLFDAIPSLRLFSERVREKTMNDLLHRTLMHISYTTEDKYLDFTRSFPDVFNRVPLHMIASYLGVSRETLSRVRHGQATGKRNQQMEF